MCGIVGYIGMRQAGDILLDGLEKLEYRGYDSSGIAVMDGGAICLVKAVGRLSELKSRLNGNGPAGTLGIGHTRWATHGKPSDENSHPHAGNTDRFAVVHNGIIENYGRLKSRLIEEGHVFRSETDTEVLPHLLEDSYDGDFLQAVRKTVSQLEGSYAFAAISSDNPQEIIAVRKDSPLVAGIGDGEIFLASDIPAVLKYTRSIMIFEDGEMARITPEGVEVYNEDGARMDKDIQQIDWDIEAAEKGGFPHFMIKEIFEQPQAVRKTLAGRISGTRVSLNLDWSTDEARAINKVAVIACGTACYAGMVGRSIFEQLLRIPVSVDVASEFRYMNPIVDEQTLALVISQSGETADTLAGLREAKARGARVVAITNVVGSSIAREADQVLYTQAGPEIAVASTKAYVTQLVGIYLLALYLGVLRGSVTRELEAQILDGLEALPQAIEDVLDRAGEIIEMADRIKDKNNVFFIGRGVDHTASLEGALKLKEISYIHAEAYAAGELKHGTIALIEPGVPVISLATQGHLLDKMVSNIKEVKARGAEIYGFGFNEGREIREESDQFFQLPESLRILAPVVTVIPLQMLAYYVSVARGNDVDKPRNLAKSVTVE